jgi:hypothetical protein
MRVAFYGLAFDTPRVTFYLWSPWRSTAIEHKLFDAIRNLPGARVEEGPDELRIHLTEPKPVRAAIQAVERVLKGWQEDADPGSEKRSWRWLLEADTDAHGYDHAGEPTALWGFLRLALDRGGLGEPEKGEDVELEGFGLQIAGESV